MTSQYSSVLGATVLLIIISIFFVRHLWLGLGLRPEQKVGRLAPTRGPPEPTRLSRNLMLRLPENVIFPHNVASFNKSMNSYWAQQECEVVPACVVRPRNIGELCTAVTIIKREYDESRTQSREERSNGLFAIRSGGHSPVPGAASIKGGVLIDLGLFSEVTPSKDGTTVVLGTGAKWMDVSKVLDERGLAVAGGRNSDIGVGGLILGGGLSFFSPRVGFVCSNIISYEIVLASGSVITASASSNPRLFHALKGGSNNFGVVTRFVARSFPTTNIWSGFLYVPSFQANKVLAILHEDVKRSESGDRHAEYDNFAAGPLACFCYIHALGFQIIAVNLVYTKLPEQGNKWPTYWRNHPFASLWRLWSTCKVRTLTSATDEMKTLNPPGRRQVFATTTIKNDPATISAAHTAYCEAIASLRSTKVKGLVWSLILQPLQPAWALKGGDNPLGLQDTSEPLIIVSFSINWDELRDDELIQSTTRCTIEQIEAAAAARGTGHRYRLMNYCAVWQKPFEGYGEENLRFLQGVSREYDPEGLFQKGCVGGFKLGIADGEA